jgi:NAD(P)-dependent dehydrogenase (short-subunit alcohol dehydrogenase family)
MNSDPVRNQQSNKQEKEVNIQNSVALVTGANRGLGKAFVQALLGAGAKKVYAAARDPATIAPMDGVIPLKLDVTNSDHISAAARDCGDVTLLINNAGIMRGAGLLDVSSLDSARAEWETMCFGPLALSQAFAPILAANGGGAILNVLSALSWISIPGAATYSSAKAAAWSLTNGLRNELSGQGTQVLSLHIGFMDTDMIRGLEVPKADPHEVARRALEGVQQGEVEVLADSTCVQLKQGLGAGVYLQPPSVG